MMRSLYSGVSGIKVHQTRMDVVGNNIANINTVGFKGSRTTFSDMFSQMQRAASAPTEALGGVNPRQIGLGVNVESIDLIFTDSSPQSTGKNTDLALTGNGLFYLKNGEDSFYTRNGSFLFDEEGHYVMAGNGYRVQGWNAIGEGAESIINTNGASTDVIVPVGKTMEATETTRITYSGNLDKESNIIKSISFTKSTSAEADARLVATGDEDEENKTVTNATSVNVDGENVVAATITFKDDTQLTVTSGYYEVGKSIPITTLATIYDSLGGKHEVTLLIDKDPDSSNTAATPTDPDALATATAYKYTAADGNTYTATKSEDPVYQYTTTGEDGETNTQYVPESDVTATAWALRSNISQEVFRDETGYYYTNANDERVDVAESDLTETAWALASDANQAVTKADVYQYTANGTTNYISATDENLTAIYDNRWRVYIAPGIGEKGPAAGEDFANTYTRTESADGSLTRGTMNMLAYLYFNDRGAFVNNGRDENASVLFSYSEGNGASSNQAVMEFSNLTQYANSTTSFPSTNGNAAGILQSIAIDGNGIVTGSYTNGLLRAEAQIAVAQFANPSGLTKFGTTIYQQSNNSGEANIRTVEDFGLSVTASALEMSNVDLATEFAEMIVTQRGFQANSKITTVSDEMLETLVNMKR